MLYILNLHMICVNNISIKLGGERLNATQLICESAWHLVIPQSMFPTVPYPPPHGVASSNPGTRVRADDQYYSKLAL